MRICSECLDIMIDGYCIEGGWAYYCSEECLHKHYTPEEWTEMYGDGETDNYWTEWYDKDEMHEDMYETAYKLGAMARGSEKVTSAMLRPKETMKEYQLKFIISEVAKNQEEIDRVKFYWEDGWRDTDKKLRGINPHCDCDYKESRFYQEHGSCQWCYFVGEDVEQ